MNDFADGDYAVAPRAVPLESMSIIEKTVANSRTGGTLETVEMVCKYEESGSTVESLNTDLAAVWEQFCG